LYERYHSFALKIVFRYIYKYEEALEITNDGFVKFFKNIEKFTCTNEPETEKLLAGWMRKIMINTAIDLLRKKMLLPEIGGIPDYVWNIKDKSATAEQQLMYKELILLIKKLPPVYRVIFNMQVIDGYTHSEISKALGIPVNTSKSHLSRARVLLKEYLNKKEEIAPFKSERSYDASFRK
jgi:RNA polymerase sigma factor (sigma-70 family)